MSKPAPKSPRSILKDPKPVGYDDRQVRFSKESHKDTTAKPGISSNATSDSATATSDDTLKSAPLAGEPGVSTTFTHTSTNPSRSVFVAPQSTPGFLPHVAGAAPTQVILTPPYQSAFGVQILPFGIMGDYSNCAQPNIGISFQPPVPDTTNGPIPHTYIPRHDVPFGGGLMYTSGAHPQGVTVIPTTTQPVMVTQPPGLQQQPIFSSQPVYMHGQPIVMSPGPMGLSQPVPGLVAANPLAAAAAVPVAVSGLPAGFGFGMGGVPVVSGNAQLPPDIMGIGKTGGEVSAEQLEFAYANKIYEPQDFKPADDDPSRYYPVREVDGNWTQRNRYTIDNLGDCRWYVTEEGYFYAVRMPN